MKGEPGQMMEEEDDAVERNVLRLDQIVGRAFLIARLLTGSDELAENAVIEAISTWDAAPEPEGALLWHTALAALTGPCACWSPGGNDGVARLPEELENVRALAAPLRHCFVLRMLGGWSTDVCSRLLRMNPRRVERYTCAAIERLSIGCQRAELSAAALDLHASAGE